MARGKLRIYLGAAPGVGKTYAMLSEAHRRVERGTDCVVAFVEHHGRRRVEVRVVDRGPGVPDEAKHRIFEPFQRYGDSPRGNGVGLGLAVARGFAEAIGGTLSAEDTPGGGLTMVLSVPTAPQRRPEQPGLSTTATS